MNAVDSGGGDFSGLPRSSLTAQRRFERAVGDGDIDAVVVLLDDGCDVNTRFDDGYTALHVAARNGDRPMVELLISRGADRTLENRWKETPSDVARIQGQPDIEKILHEEAPPPPVSTR